MSREFCRKVWSLIYEEIEGQAAEGRRTAAGDRVAGEIGLLDLCLMAGSAVDLTEGQGIGHAQRVAYIAQELAVSLDLGAEAVSDLTCAALLHDTGLLRITHELNDITSTEESELLKTHALDAVEDLATHVRQGNIQKISELMVRHTREGGAFVAGLPLSFGVGRLVEEHHERYDGHGYPSGKRGDDIQPIQQALTAGDCLETAVSMAGERGHSPEFVRAESLKLGGRHLDPDIAKELVKVAQNVRFWGIFTGGQVAGQLAARIPQERTEVTYLDAARFIRRLVSLVDAKSPYRDGHSWNVARNAYLMALELGLDEETAASLGMAGLLHDLGKAGVSNQILDKPKWLTGPEYEEAKKHIVYTDRILLFAGSLFDEVRGWIAHHHERLDGSGYPDRLKGDQISREVRVVATADVYDALISDRPYRKGLEPMAAVRFMEGKVNRYFDPEVLAALGAVVSAGPD
ncbi:MAG: HD domain-containing protein [bacterium]